MRCIFLGIFFLFPLIVFTQERAKKLNDLALDIYKSQPKKAIAILEEGLNIAIEDKEIGRLKNSLGVVYRDLGEFEKSKALSKEALVLTKDSIIVASAYNNIGVTNRNLGLYDESIEYYLKALHIYEAKKMTKEMAVTNNNIGLVYSYNNLNDKAIEYHLKAKVEFEKLNDQKGISEVYNNIAIIYANEGDLKKALDYFKYSLEIETALNDPKGIAESVNNVGAVYYYMEEIDSALTYFQKSVVIEKTIENYVGVGASYNNIAQVLIEKNRVSEAKKYIDSAYYYSVKYKSATDIQTALVNYSEFYQAKNDSKKALEYFKDYIKVKDSVLNLETNSKIAELEIQYQTKKKENEILLQKADILNKEQGLKTKNYQIIGLIGLALVLSLFGYLLYNQQKHKNLQLKKESELKEALVKIETQNKLQEQRLRISRDLHDNIGAQLTFIISSLDNLKYGFKLPDNLNDKLKYITAFTSSTIYELRDTIWAMNKSEITFEDLQSRISNFIEKANKSSHAVTFNFNVDKELKNHKMFTSVQGMNVYRIIQEAINNALKYADATQIDIDFSLNNGIFEMTISDNGIGFDLDQVALGNGINNMKKRAHELEAEFEITSQLNNGTTIRVYKTRNT